MFNTLEVKLVKLWFQSLTEGILRLITLNMSATGTSLHTPFFFFKYFIYSRYHTSSISVPCDLLIV